METKSGNELKIEDGTWANEQRRLYSLGLLATYKVKKLESVPGWTWVIEGPIA
jgi:hypothetical protein